MILDRAGFVGNDGPTHHGCYDLAYLGCIPNLTIMSPSDEIELKNMVMTCAAFDDGPTVLRYPRGTGYGVDKLQSQFGYKLEGGEVPAKGKFTGLISLSLPPVTRLPLILLVSLRRGHRNRQGPNHPWSRRDD
jgi:deoxyxylulose-5-phosphate synthase